MIDVSRRVIKLRTVGVFLFALLLTLVNKTFSQQLSFVRYTDSEGLPSNIVYYVFQDSKGYLWIGTDKGVARYDGYSFEKYSTTDGMSDNEAFQIFEDSQHRIWFVTSNGVPCYYKDGIFYSEKNDPALKKVKPNGIGLKILEDKQGTIWYLTATELIQITRNGEVRSFPNKDDANFSMEYFQTKIIVISYNGLNIIENGKLTFKRPLKYQNPSTPCKSTILNGRMFFISRNILCSIDCNTIDTMQSDSLPYSLISIKNGSDNSLLIGTYLGVLKYNVQDKNIESINYPKESITSILVDNENGLWLSTLNNGVIYSSNRKSYVYTGTGNKLLGKNITCLKLFSDNIIAMGSTDFHFSIIKNNQLYNYYPETDRGQGTIRKMEMAPDSSIYITVSPYLFILDKNLKTVLSFTSSVRNIKFAGKSAYFSFGAFAYKIHSYDKSITSRWDFQTVHQIKQMTKVDTISTVRLNGVCIDNDSSIYTYGFSGIRHLINGEEVRFPFTDPIFFNSINIVQKYPNGIFCLGSNDGICLFDSHRFYIINTTNGLSSNFVNNIYHEPATNTIWVSTENGLNRIIYMISENGKFSYSINHYTVSNGLLSNKINEVFIKNDSLWIGTTKGLNIIHKNDLDIQQSPLYLTIEAVLSDSKNRSHHDNEMRIRSGDNIRIKYVTITFNRSQTISYRYKLEGLSDKWTYTNSRELEFPKLPPGEFTLCIQAVSSLGVMSEEKRIKIVVSPNYYETKSFIGLVFIAFILLLVFIGIWIFKRQRKQHQKNRKILELENVKLESEKEKAIYEMELALLEQKALRLHINPHFIFNSISAISGFYISGNYEAGKEYTSRFSKLLRLILSTTEKNMISLATEIEILKNYFDLTLLRFEDKFDYKIIVDESLDIHKTQIPSMLIQPFVENSVIHGIAPLENKGMICIKFKKEGKYMVCQIEDNGVGREKSLELSEERMHTPTGLIVTKERIRYFNNLQDELTIIDKKDEKGNSTGTLVVFKTLFEVNDDI